MGFVLNGDDMPSCGTGFIVSHDDDKTSCSTGFVFDDDMTTYT